MIKMERHEKEEYVTILDFLPNGYPFDTRPSHQKTAIAQAVGKKHFVLLVTSDRIKGTRCIISMENYLFLD